MYNQHNSKNYSNMGQLVPGYAFYDRLGDGLAANLVNMVEYIISLVSSLRR